MEFGKQFMLFLDIVNYFIRDFLLISTCAR